MHRSGRTARALKEGLSVMLIGPEDQQYYKRIVKTLNRGECRFGLEIYFTEIKSYCSHINLKLFFNLDDHLPVFPTEVDYLAGIKPRVALARQVDKEEHKLVYDIKSNPLSFVTFVLHFNSCFVGESQTETLFLI